VAPLNGVILTGRGSAQRRDPDGTWLRSTAPSLVAGSVRPAQTVGGLF